MCVLYLSGSFFVALRSNNRSYALAYGSALFQYLLCDLKVVSARLKVVPVHLSFPLRVFPQPGSLGTENLGWATRIRT